MVNEVARNRWAKLRRYFLRKTEAERKWTFVREVLLKRYSAYVAKGGPLPSEEFARVCVSFDNYDKRRGGIIDVSDLRFLLRDLGETTSDEELLQIIVSVEGEDGTLAFEDFVDIYENLRSQAGPRAEDDNETLNAFIMLGGAPDKSGKVSIPEIAGITERFGFIMSIPEMQRNAAIPSGQEWVDYDDFRSLLA